MRDRKDGIRRCEQGRERDGGKGRGKGEIRQEVGEKESDKKEDERGKRVMDGEIERWNRKRVDKREGFRREGEIGRRKAKVDGRGGKVGRSEKEDRRAEEKRRY